MEHTDAIQGPMPLSSLCSTEISQQQLRLGRQRRRRRRRGAAALHRNILPLMLLLRRMRVLLLLQKKSLLLLFAPMRRQRSIFSSSSIHTSFCVRNVSVLLLPVQLLLLLLLVVLGTSGASGAAAAESRPSPTTSASVPGGRPIEWTSSHSDGSSSSSSSSSSPSSTESHDVPLRQDQSVEVRLISEEGQMVRFALSAIPTSTSPSTSTSQLPLSALPSSFHLTTRFQLVQHRDTVSPVQYSPTITKRIPVTSVATAVIDPDERVRYSDRHHSYDEVVHRWHRGWRRRRRRRQRRQPQPMGDDQTRPNSIDTRPQNSDDQTRAKWRSTETRQRLAPTAAPASSTQTMSTVVTTTATITSAAATIARTPSHFVHNNSNSKNKIHNNNYIIIDNRKRQRQQQLLLSAREMQMLLSLPILPAPSGVTTPTAVLLVHSDTNTNDNTNNPNTMIHINRETNNNNNNHRHHQQQQHNDDDNDIDVESNNKSNDDVAGDVHGSREDLTEYHESGSKRKNNYSGKRTMMMMIMATQTTMMMNNNNDNNYKNNTMIRETSFVQQTLLRSSYERVFNLPPQHHHLQQQQQQQQQQQSPPQQGIQLAVGMQYNYDGDNLNQHLDETTEHDGGGGDSGRDVDDTAEIGGVDQYDYATVESPQDPDLIAGRRGAAQQSHQRNMGSPWNRHVLQFAPPRFLRQVRLVGESARSSLTKRSSSDGSTLNVVDIYVDNNGSLRQRGVSRRDSQREEDRNNYRTLRGDNSDVTWSRSAILPYKKQQQQGRQQQPSTPSFSMVQEVDIAALSQRTKFVSAARGSLTRHNCSMLLDKGYLPTGAETFAVLGRWGVLLCCMETGMVLVTLAVFSRECLYLYHKWPPRAALFSCAALSVFPFTAICALSAAIFPHMYDVASALVMLYLPFSLVMYYELVATYAGGCQVLWELLTDQRMPLKGPPLCCVLPPCCGPGPILTRKRQRLMRYFIYQLLAVPVLLVGVIFVCTLAGVHPGDRLEATNASPYLMLIQALSFVLGTYALVICVKLAARHLPQHALRRKFTVFHLHYTVTRLQVIFFKLTGLTASLPCIPPLSSMASGIYMSCAMLIGQCFLMSTVSQYFFLHAPPVMSLGPPPPELMAAHGPNSGSKRSGRDLVDVGGGVNHWLLSQRRPNCRSALRQNSMPVPSSDGPVAASAVASARPNAVDYADETFSSEPSEPGVVVAPNSSIQPTPSQQLSAVLTSGSNNLINNNNNNNNNHNNNNNNNIDSNNLQHHHLGVPRRVNMHAPLGRALSHPVAGMTTATSTAAPPSLSIGGLRRVPFSAPEPVSASSQCGAPASRAKLTLDLKDTHTMTLDRKRRRRPLPLRSSGASSLEDELDLEVSTMAAVAAARRRETELLLAARGERDPDETRQRSHRGRNAADLCNPLMTCSLDEALRIRELRERRARLWRVSVAGGERWSSLTSQTPPWPVTSLEEATHLSDINGHGAATAAATTWMDGASGTDSQHWLRQLPDWEFAGSGASPTRQLAAIDFLTRRPDITVSAAWARGHAAASGSEQYC